MRAINNVFVSTRIIIIISLNIVRPTSGSRIFVYPFKADDLTGADHNTRAVYYGARNLLVHKMKTWLATDDKDTESISTYLGFPPETVDLINGALTILFARAHEDASIQINNLTTDFFYACDVERMRDDADADRVSDVAENFAQIFDNLDVDPQRVVDAYTEDELVDTLRLHVEWTPRPVELCYRVTVPLMKNAMVVNESPNESVRNLQQRFIAAYRQYDAKFYETTTYYRQVLFNYTTLVFIIIPDLLGFAYNHLELFTELRRRDLTGLTVEQLKPVTARSPFLLVGFDVFTKRYYRFKGIQRHSDIALSDAITPLVDFFDPSGDDALSIRNYNSPADDYDDRAWKLMNDGLAKVLSVFTRDKQTVEEWKTNRTITVNYPSGELDTGRLLDLMNINSEEAYAFYELLRSDLVQ